MSPRQHLEVTSRRGNFTLSVEEERALLLHTLDVKERCVLELMLYSGLRRREVCNLNAAALDFQRGEIRFLGKGGKTRLAPMPPFLTDHLREHLSGRRSGPVFPTRTISKQSAGGRISPEGVAYIVRNAGARASIKARGPGLKFLNPHTLRHTFARKMKTAGMPWEDLALLMGHTDVKTTLEIYGTRDYEEVKAAYLKAISP